MNDHVVYPTHGVGRIMKIEEQEVAGTKLELFVITFEKDKMTLRVPTLKAKAVGMRKLSSPDIVNNALNTLKGRARELSGRHRPSDRCPSRGSSSYLEGPPSP